jgi:hypothetical protein
MPLAYILRFLFPHNVGSGTVGNVASGFTGLKVWGPNPGEGQETYHVSSTSRMTLQHTQSHTKLVQELFPGDQTAGA